MAEEERQDNANVNRDGGQRPIPDPTLLTTQQLLRELTTLKELVFSRIEGMDEALRIRLDGMDEATRLLQTQQLRVPSDTDKAIQHLRELTETRFESIEVQFKERDTRTEQTSKDSKVAVDAALQAAKEAVGEQNKSSALAIAKSEASTAKQIDQLQTLIATTNQASTEKIADLKDRLAAVEGRAAGSERTEKSVRDNSSLYVAAAALLAAIVIGVMTLSHAPAAPSFVYAPPPAMSK